MLSVVGGLRSDEGVEMRDHLVDGELLVSIRVGDSEEMLHLLLGDLFVVRHPPSANLNTLQQAVFIQIPILAEPLLLCKMCRSENIVA